MVGESLGLPGDPTSPSESKSVLSVHWKDWGWGWNSNTLATSCEELTHWKWPWCWEGLGAGGEGDDRGWDGWMGSPTRWTWVWVNSGSWWWTGRPGVLQFMGSQRFGLDWATELNWSVWLVVLRFWYLNPEMLMGFSLGLLSLGCYLIANYFASKVVIAEKGNSEQICYSKIHRHPGILF